MRARLDEEAARQLMALPQPVRSHVSRFIQTLAANPHAHSRPAAFPHPLDGQLADTKCVKGDEEHFITLMFKYSADEQHINVAWIVHRRRFRAD